MLYFKTVYSFFLSHIPSGFSTFHLFFVLHSLPPFFPHAMVIALALRSVGPDEDKMKDIETEKLERHFCGRPCPGHFPNIFNTMAARWCSG